jgi:hypothetical protein
MFNEPANRHKPTHEKRANFEACDNALFDFDCDWAHWRDTDDRWPTF